MQRKPVTHDRRPAAGDDLTHALDGLALQIVEQMGLTRRGLCLGLTRERLSRGPVVAQTMSLIMARNYDHLVERDWMSLARDATDEEERVRYS